MKRKPFSLDKNKTAMVIVDMQNDFVRVGAPLEVSDARKTIEPIRKLITHAREMKIPIIYTKFIAGPRYTLIWEWSPMIENDLCCFRGHSRRYGDSAGELECTDIIQELYPQKGDYLVEKYGYSAFNHTNLVDILRAEHKDTLLVVGTVSQICVEDTVRGAFHEQFKVLVVEDGVSSFDTELHQAALKGMAMKYARVETLEEFLPELVRE